MRFSTLQKNRIKFLINTPTYGKILEKAIIHWTKDVKIGYRDFGINLSNGKLACDKKCACLIGAALIDQSYNIQTYDNSSITPLLCLLTNIASNTFNINTKDIWTIANAFDGFKYCENTNINAFNFGQEVHRLFKKRRCER